MTPPTNGESSPAAKMTTLVVLGEEVPMNAFVEKLLHKLVLAVVTSLHAPELTGTEKVHIKITK